MLWMCEIIIPAGERISGPSVLHRHYRSMSSKCNVKYPLVMSDLQDLSLATTVYSTSTKQVGSSVRQGGDSGGVAWLCGSHKRQPLYLLVWSCFISA